MTRRRKIRRRAKPAVKGAIAPPAYIFGRPTKLTPELAKTLIESARAGVLLQGCADRAGITAQTLTNWLHRGENAAKGIETQALTVEDGERGYLDFFGAFQKARGDREAEALLDIRSMRRGWQAQAWWLERTKPLEYGRRFVRLEHTGNDGKPIQHADVSDGVLTDAERWKRVQAIMGAGQ